jgi:ribosomal protein L33|tara:strand:- start:219 stop:389 length:171 start_codon:yes stop_codon:yes gene_type:complete
MDDFKISLECEECGAEFSITANNGLEELEILHCVCCGELIRLAEINSNGLYDEYEE